MSRTLLSYDSGWWKSNKMSDHNCTDLRFNLKLLKTKRVCGEVCIMWKDFWNMCGSEHRASVRRENGLILTLFNCTHLQNCNDPYLAKNRVVYLESSGSGF